MHVRSLGYRTDLIFHRFSGVVVDRGSYLVIRTPDNPTYRWGNFLLFDAPPAPIDRVRWEALFAKEIGIPPEVAHKVFGWDAADGREGEIAPFVAAGYRLETSVVMAAGTLSKPPNDNPALTVRQLGSDADFAEMLELHVLCRDPGEGEAGYRTFWGANVQGFRKIIAAGLGAWFGAFWGGTLVGSMGLFVEGELARYQAVVTHPAFRRRGVCRTLLFEVGRYGLENLGAKTLVIVADEAYFAKDIYASVGFKARERQVGLEWFTSKTG